MGEVKRISRKVIHKGRIIDYCQDTMQRDDGNTVLYDHIQHKGAAAVVPVLDDGRIVLVRQFRNSVDKYTWEIPAGGLNYKEEATIDAAKRELQEETGYTTGEPLEFLITIHTTVAFCNEKIDIFVAHNLHPGEQHLDADEAIDVKAFTIEEIKELIYSAHMTDAKTIAAIMSYDAKYCK